MNLFLGLPKKFVFIAIILVLAFGGAAFILRCQQKKTLPLGASLARAVQEHARGEEEDQQQPAAKKQGGYDQIFREFWEAQIPEDETEITWLR